MSKFEIERKFLIDILPKGLEQYPVRHLEQVYLSTNPVVRMRRCGEECWVTCKGSGLLVREEQEIPLMPEAYERLLKKADGVPIVKDRYRVPFGAYTIELDVFAEPFAPLVMAEVEFPGEREAADFEPPDWFGREVTYDPNYTNAALSQRLCKQPDSGEIAILPGRYRHFKGKEYLVMSVATHSETLEPMVVYRALYGARGVWVRPAAMWNDTVMWDGVERQRFTYLGDEPEE